jgi:hypothetical protein
MNKADFIQMHGEVLWAEKIAAARRLRAAFTNLNYSSQQDALRQLWKKQNPRKSVKNQTEIQAERDKIRARDGRKWRSLKQQYFQELDVHHSWVEDTSNYLGAALVEKEAHRKGLINVVQILEGQITE